MLAFLVRKTCISDLGIPTLNSVLLPKKRKHDDKVLSRLSIAFQDYSSPPSCLDLPRLAYTCLDLPSLAARSLDAQIPELLIAAHWSELA